MYESNGPMDVKKMENHYNNGIKSAFSPTSHPSPLLIHSTSHLYSNRSRDTTTMSDAAGPTERDMSYALNKKVLGFAGFGLAVRAFQLAIMGKPYGHGESFTLIHHIKVITMERAIEIHVEKF